MKPVEFYITAAVDLIRPIFRPDEQLASEEHAWDSQYSQDLQQAAAPAVAALLFAEKVRLAAALFRHSPGDDISGQACRALRGYLDEGVLQLRDRHPLTTEDIAAALDLAMMMDADGGYPDAVVPWSDFLARTRWAVQALPQPARA